MSRAVFRALGLVIEESDANGLDPMGKDDRGVLPPHTEPIAHTMVSGININSGAASRGAQA